MEVPPHCSSPPTGGGAGAPPRSKSGGWFVSPAQGLGSGWVAVTALAGWRSFIKLANLNHRSPPLAPSREVLGPGHSAHETLGSNLTVKSYGAKAAAGGRCCQWVAWLRVAGRAHSGTRSRLPVWAPLSAVAPTQRELALLGAVPTPPPRGGPANTGPFRDPGPWWWWGSGWVPVQWPPLTWQLDSDEPATGRAPLAPEPEERIEGAAIGWGLRVGPGWSWPGSGRESTRQLRTRWG